ncbi:MAG: hypothetical protein Q9O74_09385 [Planctomycetota bacterium]|nr:hypothetical protein [Planctomycetota bacterium]
MHKTPGRRCPGCDFEAATERELQRCKPNIRVVVVGALATAIGLGLTPVAFYVRSWETTGYANNTGPHPLNALFAGVTAFAFVLFVWAVRGERSKGRRRCPGCWYDMRGSLPTPGDDDAAHEAGFLCPECGTTTQADRDLYKARRRPRVAMFALVVLFLSLYSQTIPRALRTGTLGLVPTSALILGSAWLPEGWYADPTRNSEATLHERIANRELWKWQRQWAAAVGLRSLKSGSYVKRPAVYARMLDWQNFDHHERVIHAMLRLLSDPERRLSSARADEILNWYGILLWLPGGGVDSPRADALRKEIAAAEPALSMVVRQAQEPEAALAIRLLGLTDPETANWVPALAARAGSGGKTTVSLAVQYLTLYAAERPEACAAIEKALSAGGANAGAAQRGLSVWSYGFSSSRKVETCLALVRSSSDQTVVFAVAEAFTDGSFDLEPFHQLVQSAKTPDIVRAGLASGWQSGCLINISDAIPLVIPALAHETAFVRDPVLWFVRQHLDKAGPWRDEILAVVLPLASDEDEITATLAKEIIDGLATSED